jgi:hypothetical protein
MTVRRGCAREPGRSDPIDVRAVAMAALRELICRSPDWTAARVVKLVPDH